MTTELLPCPVCGMSVEIIEMDMPQTVGKDGKILAGKWYNIACSGEWIIKDFPKKGKKKKREWNDMESITGTGCRMTHYVSISHRERDFVAHYWNRLCKGK
jgi:hypothetical protein